MLQDQLPKLIKLAFNLKILVASSYKAKQTLVAKGLTPSIFLDRFYRETMKGSSELTYNFKQRQLKPMPDFITIDLDEYQQLRRDDRENYDIDEQKLSTRMVEVLNQQQLKYVKAVDRSVFADRASVEKFINNQGFHWFETATNMYYHALNLGQENYRVSTADQPVGLCYVLEVEKQKSAKEVFDKVRGQTDLILRKLYQLTPDQIKNVKVMMLLLFNQTQGCTIQQALQYSKYFKQSVSIHSNLIHRLPINIQDAKQSYDWHQFNRPIIHFSYNLKPGEPVRIISDQSVAKLKETINYHKQTIRKVLESRLDDLAKKYEETNKATKIIASFFRGSTPNDKTYTREEVELRELGDKMFIMEDYRRAYDIYKSLAGKMDKRNPAIENNLSQMIQFCLAMSKFHSVKLKSEPYHQIEKYAENIMRFYDTRNKSRLKRYLIFLMYVFHTFRAFERRFMRLYYNFVKSSSALNTTLANPLLNIMSTLIYEQYANINLLYPSIEPRRYCYDIIRASSRFSQMKMYTYTLRCLKIVEDIYNDTFPNIEKYKNTQLGHVYLELKQFKNTIHYMRKTWQVYVNRIENENEAKNDEEFKKQFDNYRKMLADVEKYAPEALELLQQPNLGIPVVHSLNLQTKEQTLEFDEKSGIKWQEIGENILESKQLLSLGFNQRDFRNVIRTFDSGVPEEKCLIHKYNSDKMVQAILKRNSRHAYVGEPVKLSFYLKNPLRQSITVTDIKIKLKQSLQNCKIVGTYNNLSIQPFKSQQVSVTLIPDSPGYLQLQEIQYTFMKLINSFRIKQPHEAKSEQSRTCYFKLNINPPTGCLETKSVFQEHYYEGEKGTMKIIFKNVGCEPVTRVYIASGDPEMFGFKIKELSLDLGPGESRELEFSVSVPLVGEKIESGEEKKICKLLIIYKTGDRFRLTRTINKFNIIRIAKFTNFVCERLSNHLHLLSFSRLRSSKQAKQDNGGLEWMLIPGGFEVIKEEAARLTQQTNYFFFIRRAGTGTARFQFQSWVKDIGSYPEDFTAMVKDSNSQDIDVRFLWNREQRMGYLSYQNIPITIKKSSYLSSKYPINFKINYPRDLTHNFRQQPYLQIPISIKLKNVFEHEQMTIKISFVEGNNNDASWQGFTEKKLKLRMGAESLINIVYVVVKPGLYNLAKQIKYDINEGKEEFRHAEYEQLYLNVKAAQEQQNKIDFEDAFRDFGPAIDTKTMELNVQEYSLI